LPLPVVIEPVCWSPFAPVAVVSRVVVPPLVVVPVSIVPPRRVSYSWLSVSPREFELLLLREPRRSDYPPPL
jgi:hypothetical protein